MRFFVVWNLRFEFGFVGISLDDGFFRCCISWVLLIVGNV